MKRGAVDFKRRKTILARFNLRAHLRERFMMRSIGRRESDSSPKMRLVNGWPASKRRSCEWLSRNYLRRDPVSAGSTRGARGLEW